MMNLRGIATCNLAHGLDAFPIGKRHELGFILAVLAERLDTQGLVEERLDACFVVVGFVLVGAVARGSPTSDADNGRLLEGRSSHDKLLLWDKDHSAIRQHGDTPSTPSGVDTSEEIPHQCHDLREIGLQRPVASVEQVQLSVRQIAQIGVRRGICSHQC
jgi:hypothetical protein